MDCSYVEEFWAMVGQIQEPTELPVRANYHLFREGIKPMWEDPTNIAGGKWQYCVQKKNRSKLNELWTELMVLCIGEITGDHAQDVCGVVVAPRQKVSGCIFV
jgi:translation initiation factor 4E